MAESSTSTPCPWCGRAFTPRRDGGKTQRFCREPCRRSYDAAGRRWVAKAIAGGTLTLDDLRSGAAATRALLSGAMSPAPIHPAEKPVPGAPADSPDDAAELLNDLLHTLLVDLPAAWSDLIDAIPEGLFDRLDRYLDTLLSEPNGG